MIAFHTNVATQDLEELAWKAWERFTKKQKRELIGFVYQHPSRPEIGSVQGKIIATFENVNGILAEFVLDEEKRRFILL